MNYGGIEVEDYRKYKLDQKEKILFFMAGYSSVFFLSYLFYHSLIFSAITGFSAILFKKQCCEFMNNRRKKEIVMEFKDLLYSLGASIATGRYITEALMDSEENIRMIHGEKSIMYKELQFINRQISENHVAEEVALMDFAQRSGIEDIRSFVEIYGICKYTGGNLQSVISSTSDTLMEKIKLQQEIKNMMLEKQFEGRIVGIIPIVIISFLNISSPSYLAPLYSTWFGRIVMTMCLLGFIGAICWMIKLTEDKVL